MSDNSSASEAPAKRPRLIADSSTLRMYRAISRELMAKHNFEVVVMGGVARITKRGGEGHATRWTFEVDFTGGRAATTKP